MGEMNRPRRAGRGRRGLTGPAPEIIALAEARAGPARLGAGQAAPGYISGFSG